MSAARTQHGRLTNAVVWRLGATETCCGRLEVHDDELVLWGANHAQELRISLHDVASVSIGRRSNERIDGVRTLIIERRSGERLLAYVVGPVASLADLRDTISALVHAEA